MRLKPIRGIIRAQLEVDAPPTLAFALEEMFTFPNPQYIAAVKYSPHGWVSNRIPKEIQLWSFDRMDNLLVPRGINIRKLPEKALRLWRRIVWEDARTYSPAKFPAFQLTLTKEQQYLTNGAIRLLRQECPFGNFLFVAPTSAGKTIVQAEIARSLGQRTLVLCLTEQIKRSWYGDLLKAYSLTENDVGLIQQSVWRIGDCFTLASVKTLIKRKSRWQELFKQIGTVIIDEAHTITAPSIHRFVMACPAAYIIGATATDAPVGSNKFYLPSILGSVRRRIVAQQRDTATSLALKDVETIPTEFNYMTPKGVLDWNDLALALCTDERRNSLIVQNVLSDWENGESVLVVTKRLMHVHLLADMLKEAGIADTNILTGETNANRFYTEKLVARILDRKVRCVVATIPAIKLGANLNPMSVLHLAIPVANKRDLEQLIGRIRRRATAKQTCILRYYLDVKFNYLTHLYAKVGIPVFRKLRVPKFRHMFVA